MKYIIIVVILLAFNSCTLFFNKSRTDTIQYKEIAYIDTICQRIMQNPDDYNNIIKSDKRFRFDKNDSINLQLWKPYEYFKKYEFELCDFKVEKTYLIDVNGDSTTFGGCLLYKTKNNIYAMFDLMNKNNQVFFTIIDVREQRKCKEWNPYIN